MPASFLSTQHKVNPRILQGYEDFSCFIRCFSSKSCTISNSLSALPQQIPLPVQSSIRIPLINLLNEQVAVDIKKKVEVTLDMKAQHGEFIGLRAPFGYQKSCENPNQLIPDPVAAITVRKIFELAAGGEARQQPR